MAASSSTRKPKPMANPKGLEYLQDVYFAGPRATTAPDVPGNRIFPDPSGMPRFEQPDNEARLLGLKNITDYYAKLRRPGPRMEGDPASDLRATTVPLSDILQHDLLFQDYSELKDMPVMLLPTGEGYYTPGVAGYSPQDRVVEDFTDKSYVGGFEAPFHADPFTGRTQVFTPERKEMLKKLITSDVGAIYLTPDQLGLDRPYQNFGAVPNDFVNDFQESLLGATMHEVQHGIGTFEGADKYGAHPTDFRDVSELQKYLARPTEMESFLAQSRMKMPEDQRFRDMPIMANLFEKNAAWKNEGIAGQYVDDILAESGIYPDDPNYRSAYAEVMRNLMDNAIAEESMVP